MSYEGKIVLNYKLTRKLGEGGFGAVYLAEHESLGRRVAIKVLHHQFASQPAIVERFFREARAVCEIGHRAIIAIENFGTLPDTNEPFYLMEFFSGGSLHQITTERWLTSDQLIAIFDPVADALSAAHAKGIIHRDLKPDNIMVRIANDQVADVRLLDFGIAKLLDGAPSTMTGSAMGTPQYMPPEQALDAKHVDLRADVYSFAATIYAGVSGRPPFDADSVAGILLAVQQIEAAPLPLLRPDVTAELDGAIRRCLAKSRDQRPATVAEAWAAIRSELQRAALTAMPSVGPRNHPRPDTPRPMVATPVAVTPPAISAVARDAPATTPEVRSSSKRSLVLGIAALAVVFGAVVIVVAKMSGGSLPSSEAPPVVALQPPVSVPQTVSSDARVAIDAEVIDAAPVSVDATEPPVDAAKIGYGTGTGRNPGSGSKPGPGSGSAKPVESGKCSEAYFGGKLAAAGTNYDALLEELNKCRAQLGTAFTRLQQQIVQKTLGSG